MGGGRSLKGCYITPVGSFKDWTAPKISQWINHSGGISNTSISHNTTHLVVRTEAWKAYVAATENGKEPVGQAAIVQQGMKLKEDGKDIKIVSFDWLEDSLRNKTKKPETTFLWEKLEKADATPRKKAAKDVEPRGHTSLLKEVFQKSTDEYVTKQEKAKLDKEIERRERAAKEMEKALKNQEREEEEKKKAEKRLKNAASFKNGVKKARNEIFSGG